MLVTDRTELNLKTPNIILKTVINNFKLNLLIAIRK